MIKAAIMFRVKKSWQVAASIHGPLRIRQFLPRLLHILKMLQIIEKAVQLNERKEPDFLKLSCAPKYPFCLAWRRTRGVPDI